jgi:uncharacterized protein
VTLLAALLAGLAASGHCALMCGGIASALGVASGYGPGLRPPLRILALYQLGRMTSYALAGVAFATAWRGLAASIDSDVVRASMRVLSGLTFILGSLIVLGVAREPASRLTGRLWLRLATLGRGLLPVTTLPRAWAFGMIWGWMPCSFVYTMLIIVTVGTRPLAGGAVMAAFGLGTFPAMFATSLGASGLARAGPRRALSAIAAAVLLACGVSTLASPWLANVMPSMDGWLPWQCRTGTH